MSLRLAVLLCAVVAFTAIAQDRGPRSIAGQPSYTRMAAECGKDPLRRSFSSGEYAQAFIEAELAIRDAKAGNSSHQTRVNAIEESVAQLKKCLEQDFHKIPYPPIRNCDDLVREFWPFMERLQFSMRILGRRVSYARKAQVRESFREPVQNCVSEIFSKCVDPNSTSDVHRALELANIASTFGLMNRAPERGSAERFLWDLNPNRLQLKFCTDTDWACKGDPFECGLRLDRIRRVLDSYFEQ